MALTNNLNICFIGEHEHISSKEFGEKAYNLNRLAITTKLVPRAFIINTAMTSSIATGKCSDEDLKVLNYFFDKLLSDSVSKKIIVRSSSKLEDVAEHQFPGLFKSIQNVEKFTSLVTAIRHINKSSQSKNISDYIIKCGLEQPLDHLALIVQEQITFEYSAIVQIDSDGCLVEAFHGQLAEPIGGDAIPTTIRIRFATEKGTVLSSNPQQISSEVISEISSGIYSLTQTLNDQFRMPFLLEMGFCGRTLYLLQIRNILSGQQAKDSVSTISNIESAFPFLPRNKEIGIKAAAMIFFQKKGLFDLPLRIYEPFVDPGGNELLCKGPEWANGPFTIRFSHKDDLSLPRLFIRTAEEILPAIRQNRRAEWAVLIHKFIEVRRSFELLLFGNSVLLEHIPGLWESENRLPPDVLEVRNNSGRAWLWCGEREAVTTFIKKSQKFISPPVTKELTQEWIEKLIIIIRCLASPMSSCYPINIHFVEDCDGKWYFLNIRQGFFVDEPPPVVSPVHVVETIKDLESWDQKSSILLRVSTSRGREADLLPLIDILPQDKLDIFIDCGVLSHPSMVLRENKINVFPAYMAHPPIEFIQSYKEVPLDIDFGIDPIERILKESARYTDKEFHVVTDRNPIVKQHLLVVSKQDFASIADLPIHSSMVNLLEREEVRGLYDYEPLLFVEHGRAKFCTSEYTNCHAHGHILPLESFKQNIVKEFVESTKAVEFSSLTLALAAARENPFEYLLLCINGGKTYLSSPIPKNAQRKRFFRTFLKERERV
ncbi:MAG: PEP/pyruvate-binding domain-containing protein [Thermodesulfobacteriota bacterium]